MKIRQITVLSIFHTFFVEEMSMLEMIREELPFWWHVNTISQA